MQCVRKSLAKDLSTLACGSNRISGALVEIQPNACQIHTPCIHTYNAECALYYNVRVRKPHPLSHVEHLAYETSVSIRGQGIKIADVCVEPFPAIHHHFCDDDERSAVS